MTKMIRAFRRFLRNTGATAAVEAAIFAPIFVILMLGITDLGSMMFVRMTVNAAVQAGAGYAVINSGTGSVCSTSLTTACLNGVNAAMNDAAANSSFCSGSVCTVRIQSCADGFPKCIIVSAGYPFTPLLPAAAYSWAQSLTVSYTSTIRIL